MYKGLDLRFGYAIRFKDGTYWTGNCGKEAQGERVDAYTYTQAGAHDKIDRMVLEWPELFIGAIVERIS